MRNHVTLNRILLTSQGLDQDIPRLVSALAPASITEAAPVSPGAGSRGEGPCQGAAESQSRTFRRNRNFRPFKSAETDDYIYNHRPRQALPLHLAVDSQQNESIYSRKYNWILGDNNLHLNLEIEHTVIARRSQCLVSMVIRSGTGGLTTDPCV